MAYEKCLETSCILAGKPLLGLSHLKGNKTNLPAGNPVHCLSCYTNSNLAAKNYNYVCSCNSSVLFPHENAGQEAFFSLVFVAVYISTDVIQYIPSLAVYSLSSIILASPKSAILHISDSETRTLAALRSRWMQFFLSMYAIPSAICNK